MTPHGERAVSIDGAGDEEARADDDDAMAASFDAAQDDSLLHEHELWQEAAKFEALSPGFLLVHADDSDAYHPSRGTVKFVKFGKEGDGSNEGRGYVAYQVPKQKRYKSGGSYTSAKEMMDKNLWVDTFTVMKDGELRVPTPTKTTRAPLATFHVVTLLMPRFCSAKGHYRRRPTAKRSSTFGRRHVCATRCA